LLPVDWDRKDFSPDKYETLDVENILLKQRSLSPNTQMIFLFDACSKDGVHDLAADQFVSAAVRIPALGSNQCVFWAAQPGGAAVADEKNSCFTACLLEKAFSANSLQAAEVEIIAAVKEKSSGYQTPMLQLPMRQLSQAPEGRVRRQRDFYLVNKSDPAASEK
ncbi:MAG: hypothetical protein EBS01_15480, partial [Verrucomicrobia bacterium]|nr:hypothetical protein [Verrucomicrobiota bacterium]